METEIERILLVGEDPAVLEAKGRLLYNWQTVFASSREAIEKLQSQSFDAIVIGQSVRRSAAISLVSLIRTMSTAPAILVIRYSNQPLFFGVEPRPLNNSGFQDGLEQGWKPCFRRAAPCSCQLDDNPSWIKKRVAGLLCRQVSLCSMSSINEVHHRGQGYVYLRSLGSEPPAFYNREMSCRSRACREHQSPHPEPGLCRLNLEA